MFDIKSGDLTEGQFPPRQTRLVSAWIERACISGQSK
jgi:hypothetical protein